MDDLAEMPPRMLEAAIKQWAVKSKWMPKASELVELARTGISSSAAPDHRTLAQKYNDRMALDPLARPDRMWIDVPGGGVKLVPKPVPAETLV